MERNVKNASKIKLLALDVDGVLTDGSLNIGADGELFKAFNARDGLGLSCFCAAACVWLLLPAAKALLFTAGRKNWALQSFMKALKIKEKYWQTLPRQEGLGRKKLPIWRRFKRPACTFICRACLCPGRRCAGGNFCQQLCCRK